MSALLPPNPRSASPHHGELVLDEWPLGVITKMPRDRLPLEALADAIGFDVDRDGKIVTEPRWLSVATTGLPSQFSVVGGYAFSTEWLTDGTYNGYIYLALQSSVTAQPFEIWRTDRRSISWSKLTGRSSDYGGRWVFARLAEKAYVANNNNGLFDLSAPTTPINDSAGNPVKGDVICTHQGRLFLASNRRIRWSAVNDGGTWSTDFFDVPPDEEGEGILGLVRWSNTVLLVFKPHKAYKLVGYPGRFQLMPLAQGNSNVGAIAQQVIRPARTQGPVLFLGSDNGIYSISDSIALVSEGIDRDRDVTTMIFNANADVILDHYRIAPLWSSHPSSWLRDQYTRGGSRQEGALGFNICTSGEAKGATTRSAQWLGGDPEAGQFYYSFPDAGFDRYIRVADRPTGAAASIYYLDTAELPSSRIFAGTTTHVIETPDFDMGTPHLAKSFPEIHARFLPTTSNGVSYCRIFYRVDAGAWTPVYKIDRADSASSLLFPIDGESHRGKFNNWRTARKIGLRIEFTNENGPGAGQGLVLDELRIVYYQRDPQKT